jgi:hypothetical protein
LKIENRDLVADETIGVLVGEVMLAPTFDGGLPPVIENP